MSDTSLESRKAFVLYFSNVSISDICSLGEVEKLRERGVFVELESSPIISPQAQYYQLFSGRLPASFGFFDTLIPAYHLLKTQQGANSYTIVEVKDGRSSTPKMFDELLRTTGWNVDYKEVIFSDLGAYVQALTSKETSTQANCSIVKCTIDQGTATSAMEAINEALRLARAWVGEKGLLALLSDGKSAPVQRYVNLNNFFAEVGVIERDEQSGLINWPGSLAYYAGHGQIWLNVLGRDAQGAVHLHDEYEEVRETLIKSLPTKLRESGTGATVVEQVYRKEEIYTGDYLFCAPDLVVLFKPGYAPSPRSSQISFDETTFTTPPEGTALRAGIHPSSIKGLLLASCPVLASGELLTGSISFTSVVPSLMHALGLEYTDMDGTAVETLFLPSYLESHPIRAAKWSSELSEEDEELVINRLRDLGYV